MSVNLSSKNFVTTNWVEHISYLLHETGLKPGCLELEITESAVMENPKEAAALLNKLREMGVQLSIDDFGTGYL